MLGIVLSIFISTAWADGPPTPPPPPPPVKGDAFNENEPGVHVWKPGEHRRMMPANAQPQPLPHPPPPDANSGHSPGKK